MERHLLSLRLLKYLRIILPTVMSVFIYGSSFAGSSNGLVYHGRIINPDGTALNSGTATFTIEIQGDSDYKYNGTTAVAGSDSCVLYRETHTKNMTGSQGTFELFLGEGSAPVWGINAAASDKKLSNLFVNNTADQKNYIRAISCSNGAAAGNGDLFYFPYRTGEADWADRKVVATINTGSATFTLAPMSLRSTPWALQAAQIGGYGPAGLMKVSGAGTSNVLTPTGANFLFDFSGLGMLVGGGALNTNGVMITGLPAPTAGSDAVNKTYVDAQISAVSAGALAADTVNSSHIVDGAIVNADINAAAAIAWSKISKTGAVASDVGAVSNAGNAPSIQTGLDAAKPAFGTAGRLYVASDTKKVYFDSGAAWVVVGTTDGADITGNISGNAATATTAGNVTGVVAIANGGTGATTAADARTNLGLGGAAVLSVGTAAGTVAAGDDTRLVNAIQNAGVGAGNVITSLQSGNTAGKPAAGTDGKLYLDIEAKVIYRDNGTTWDVLASASGAGGDITEVAAGTGLTGGGTTGSVTLGLADIASQRILANTTGGAAAPVATTVSDVLDMITGGSTQGSVLYRGGAGWSVLAPGTSGQYLQTQGAAANPQWASVSVSDFSGNLAGDVTGTQGTTKVEKIQGTAVSGVGLANNNLLQNTSGGALLGNQVLVSNGTATGVISLVSPASGVLTSSGTVPSWQATLPVSMGGTGESTYTDGQLLIGNSTGNTLTKATLTAGTGVSITNGNGSITINATGSGGTVTSVSSANTDIAVATGDSTPVLTLNSGTGADQIVKLTAAAKYPAVDGSLITNLTATALSGIVPIANGGTNSSTALNNNRLMISAGDAIVESTAMTDGQIVVGKTGAAPQLVTLSGDATISNTGSLTLGTVPVTKGGTGQSSTFTANSLMMSNGDGTAMTAGLACALNEVPKWNGTTWACSSDATGGSPSDASYLAKGIVQFLTDADTSGITVASGVANVNTGTGANQIVKLTAAAKYPAVDGSLITNITATALSGIVPVANGGTNSSTALNNNRLMISAGDAIVESAAMTDGQIVVGKTGAAPQLVTLSGDATISNTGSLTLGTVPVTKGGTGQTTFTDGQLLIGNSADSSLTKATLTAGAGVTITNGNGSITIEATGSGGDITEVAAGTGLTGGGTTGSVTLGLADIASKRILANTTGGAAAPVATSVSDVLDMITGGSTQGSVLYRDGAGWSVLAPGTSGQYLQTQGATANPQWASVSVSDFSGNLAGDVSGTQGATVVDKIKGTAVSATAPTDTQFLVYNNGSTQYAPVSLSGDATLSNTGSLTLNTVPVTKGGTGQTTFTDGQLLIGNSTGNTLTKATLTAGTGVSITNGNGSITINATGSGGTVTSVSSANTDISVATGDSTPVLTLNSGTGADQIVKLTAAAKYPAVDGSLITNLTATALSGIVPIANGGTNSSTALNNNRLMISAGDAIVEAAAMTDGQIVVGKTGAAPQLVTLSGDATISNTGSLTLGTVPVTKGGTGQSSNFTANALMMSNATGTAMTAGLACALNEVPKWNGTTWACSSDATGGSPSDASYLAKGIVQFLTDADTSGITVASGVANVNTGTGANQIVKLTAAAKYPAVDGSLITNITATALSGIVPIANGGTNSSTALNNNRLMTSVGGAIVEADAMIDGQIVVGKTGAAPQLVTLSGDATISNTGSLTLNTVPVTKGGTGQTTFTDGQLLIGNSADSSLTKATLTAGAGVTITNGNGSITIEATGSGGDITEVAAGTGLTGGGTTGSVTLGLADIASKRILANTTGGAAAPVATTVSDVLDMITGGSTQGSVLYRDAAGWSVLAPGTSGQYLQTQGATANPQWASVSVSDFSGNLAGDVSGAQGSTVVDKIQGTAVSGVGLANNNLLQNTSGGALLGNQVLVSNGTATGVTSLVSPASGVLTSSGTVPSWQATLPVSMGGTGQSTFTDGQLLIGNSTGNTLTKATLTAGTGVSITNGNGSITINATGSGGTVTSVSSANADIAVATGDSTPVLTLNSGTGADQIVKLTAAAKYPAVDGSLITNLTATALSGIVPIANGGTNSSTALNNNRLMTSVGGAIVEADAMTDGQIVVGKTGAAPQLVALSGDATISNTGSLTLGTVPVTKGGTGQSSNFTANALMMSNATGTAMIAGLACALNEVPKWNGTTWACSSDATGGSPSDASYLAKGIVQFLTDADTSGITVASGVANVNTGTGANQILKLDSNAKIPAVDGSLLTNITATNLSGVVPVANGGTGQSTFTDGQLLIGNSTGNTLTKATLTAGAGVTITNGNGSITIEATGSGGDITEVVAGTGLTGGGTAGSVTLGLADIASKRILANTTGGAAAPVATSVSDVLDMITSGSTQGSVLYRDAAGWSVLAPGTSGQYLQTQGATANPQWASVSVSDFSGNLAGDVSGTQGATVVDKIKGTAVSATAPTDTQFLVYNNGSTQYAPVSLSGDATLSNTGSLTLNTVPVTKGGTGQTTFTDGQLLIGNSTGNTLTKATLTAGTGVSITNGNGSITINATGSGGTVTSVSSANADIAVATGDSTPVLTLNSGTGADQIVKLTAAAKYPAVDGSLITNLTATALSGIVPIANGGTNSSTALNNNRLMTSVGGAIVEADAMTDGQIVVGKTGAAPQLVTLSGDATISNTGSLTLNTVPVTKGGTGQTTFTDGQLLIGNSADSSLAKATLTAGAGVTITNGNGSITIEATGSGGDITEVAAGTGLTGGGTTGSVTLGLADIASKRILANTTGGAAAPVATTVSDVLDMITSGSTQGSVLYRDAAGWSVLAPGTSGQYLQTQGATANPQWASVSVSDFSGNLAGDVTGTQGATKVEKIQGTAVSGVGLANNNLLQNTSGGALLGNQVLVSNGTATGVTSLVSPASGVLTSSGTVPSWQATLPVSMGGTGESTFTDGQLLIGNSTGNTLTKATLTAGTGVSITNGNGSITINATGSGGTVTSVSSANADISVATGDSTPVLTLNSGTGADQIVKLTAAAKYPAVDGSLITNLTATALSGIVPIANGGTNSSTALNNNRLMTSVGGAIVEAAAMTDGQIVVGKTGAAPQLVTLSGDATISNTGSLTLNTVPVTKGGTGQTSFTDGQLLIGNTTGNTLTKATLTAGAGITITNGNGSITIAKDSSTLSGTGTTNYLPMYTAASTLGDSPIAASSGNIGIGTASPGAKLQITGTSGTTLKIVDGNQASGKVLTSDAAGQASWQTPAAALTSLNGLTAATQTFAIGTSGNSPGFSSATSTHTLNIPLASTASVTAGLISNTTYAKIGVVTNTAPLANGKIWVGDAGTLAQPVTPSGDASMTNAGLITVEKIQNRTVASTAPSLGSFLKWNNTLTQWEPTVLATCIGSNKAMHYNSTTDTWSCDTISAASDWVTKTGAYTAVAGDRIMANTSGGAFTITLPASATSGDTITIMDVSGSFNTNNLTVGRNGLKIMSLAEDLALDIRYSTVELVYSDATYGWRIK